MVQLSEINIQKDLAQVSLKHDKIQDYIVSEKRHYPQLYNDDYKYESRHISQNWANFLHVDQVGLQL